jgi:uridine kinase
VLERQVAEVLGALRGSGGGAGTRLVTVDGFSGSGKSALADAVGLALVAPVLSMEELYPGWDGLAAAVPLAVEWIAAPLAAGRPARWWPWDWTRGARAGPRELAPVPLVLLEGCGSGARALRPFTDTSIWVHTPAEQRERRLRARRDWAGYAPHRARWAAREAAWHTAEQTPERADLVVDNSDA